MPPVFNLLPVAFLELLPGEKRTIELYSTSDQVVDAPQGFFSLTITSTSRVLCSLASPHATEPTMKAAR